MALKGKDGFSQLMEALVDRAKAGDFSWMQQAGGAGRIDVGTGHGSTGDENSGRKSSEVSNSTTDEGLDRKGMVA